MGKKLGTLIKQARTEAGLTQEQLARKVKNTSASDISQAERGLKELTTDQLKGIAKATGVTQKSLLDAAKGSTSSTSSSKKKTSSSAKSTMSLTATEKKLVTLYRNADSDTKKAAMDLLKGEDSSVTDALGGLVGSFLDGVFKK